MVYRSVDGAIMASELTKSHKLCVYCDASDDDVSYHAFPADQKIHKIWVSRVPKKNWTIKSSSTLCGKHFLPSDYNGHSTDSNKARKKAKDATGIKRKKTESRCNSIHMARNEAS